MIKSDSDIGAIQGKLVAALDDSPGLLVATGATLLYSIHLINGAAALTYLQCFNAAALVDVTLGTTVPTIAIPIIASAVLDIDLSKPLLFPLGLVVFSTTTATGSTGATTNGSIFYG